MFLDDSFDVGETSKVPFCKGKLLLQVVISHRQVVFEANVKAEQAQAKTNSLEVKRTAEGVQSVSSGVSLSHVDCAAT